MINTRFNALEWLTANLHKAYPLSDSVGGATPIPSVLLADMFILVVGARDQECSFYVSKILSTDNAVTIYISGSVADVAITNLAIATFSKDDVIGAEAAASFTQGSYVIHTKVVAGDVSCATHMPVIQEFEPDSGEIFSGCVRGIPAISTGGLIVNDQLLTDSVTIEPGDGIELNLVNFSAKATLKVTQTV